MSSPSVARLKDLSEEEKIKLKKIFFRKLSLRALIFVGIIQVCIIAMLYFNKFSIYKSEDNIGVLNVVFIMIMVVCGRFMYSEIWDYKKEIRSPVKRMIDTRIAGRKDGKIILGNKSFARNEILLDAPGFDSLQRGDEVTLELSAKSNTIFSIRRTSKY